MGDHGLEVARDNTDTIMFTKKWVFQVLVFFVERSRRSFGKKFAIPRSLSGFAISVNILEQTRVRHLRQDSTHCLTARLMPNLRGPSQSKIKLFMSVVNRKLPTWAERATKYTIYQNFMTQVQIIVAVRVTLVYHTILAETALFLAETLLGDLLALERKRVSSLMIRTKPIWWQRSEYDIMLAAWYNRWSHENNSSWTRRIFPDLKRSVGRCL